MARPLLALVFWRTLAVVCVVLGMIGVVLPGLIILGLMAIPYLDRAAGSVLQGIEPRTWFTWFAHSFHKIKKHSMVFAGNGLTWDLGSEVIILQILNR